MKVVGVPAFGIFMMGLIPAVKKNMTSCAKTLRHDFAILGDTQRGGPLPDELKEKLARIAVPTLTLVGGKSPPWMHHAVKRVKETVQQPAPTKLLPKQEHNVAASAVGPALVEFFLN
jgi:pimeloyl-ACP methyl ester carboxylesterase